ncbi:hypothetical protein B5B23_13255 [Salmonella enterica subsp. enterica serovar Tennessee]|nr:hypothetical protein [Salmonella enterica subsp. enterica serovar Tennessee]
MSDITALALIAKIKKQTKSFDTVVLQEGEANALVEALEKSRNWERRWKEAAERRGKRLTRQALEILQQENRIAELESRTVTSEQLQESSFRAGLTTGWNLGLANNNTAFNKCLAAHSTTGEMHSRTVTVKPPEIERPIDGAGYATAAGERRYKERVIDALRAAGIQVIEGEGQ